MKATPTAEARPVAAGYISSADADREMTRFATTGHADGWRLVQCVERNRQLVAASDQYDTGERAGINRELHYLARWVREHYGRYVLCVEREVWHESDHGWDDDSAQTTTYPMFDRLSSVAEYLSRQLLADRVEDTVWTVHTTVRSDVSPYFAAGVRSGVAVPVAEADQYTVSAAHGFTDRTWCRVIAAAQAYFVRIRT